MEKQARLMAEMNTALEAAKTLTPATPEFDEAYGQYLAAKADLAKILYEITQAKQAQNSEAIKSALTAIGEAITKLVEGLKLAELSGTKVRAITYLVNNEGKVSVALNPVVRSAPKRKWDSEHIKALRHHLGFTQQELASQMSTRQQTISEWEIGMYQPRGASATLLSIVAERTNFRYDASAKKES